MTTSEYDQIDTDSQIDLESLSTDHQTQHKLTKLFQPQPPLFHCLQHICWFHYPSQPWTLSYYFNEGQENVHIYFWLLKDLAWVQSWYLPGILIGGLACCWSIFLVWRSISHRDLNEFWSRFADLLWLFANYWWMIGETHDYEYPEEPSQYEAKTREATVIMITALVWIASYYFILKPLGVVERFKNTNPPTLLSVSALTAEENAPPPRFPSYFSSWREYENLHSLFWIGKDAAWILAKTPMWFFFFFPTLAISVDVTVTTLFRPKLLVDHAHQCAQFLWLLANAVWASGELFLTTHHDEPLGLSRFDSEARVTSRWWSSWVVIFSFLPLLILHLLWIPATLSGKISRITAQSLQENSLQFPQKDNEDAKGSSQQQHHPQEELSSSSPSLSSPLGVPSVSVFSPLFIDRTNDQSSHSVYL